MHEDNNRERSQQREETSRDEREDRDGRAHDQRRYTPRDQRRYTAGPKPFHHKGVSFRSRAEPLSNVVVLFSILHLWGP